MFAERHQIFRIGGNPIRLIYVKKKKKEAFLVVQQVHLHYKFTVIQQLQLRCNINIFHQPRILFLQGQLSMAKLLRTINNAYLMRYAADQNS